MQSLTVKVIYRGRCYPNDGRGQLRPCLGADVGSMVEYEEINTEELLISYYQRIEAPPSPLSLVTSIYFFGPGLPGLPFICYPLLFLLIFGIIVILRSF